MSKRQTLSQRFDSLAPPKYDDMSTNERPADTIDDEDQDQSNGNTTFTVVNRSAGGSSTGSRSQRISHVIESNDASTPSRINYSANRSTGSRPFRRDLNPSPYVSSSSRPGFRTNRYQHQQRTGENVFDSSRSNTYDNNNTKPPRFSDFNGNNRRDTTRGRGWISRWRGSRVNTTRGTRANSMWLRYGNDMRRSRNGPNGGGTNANINGNNANIRGGRKRGRGDMNRGRSGNKRNLTQKDLDKELEKYYASKDPKKLSEMKNDELDRELDEYWTKPDKTETTDNADEKKKTQKWQRIKN